MKVWMKSILEYDFCKKMVETITNNSKIYNCSSQCDYSKVLQKG
jgi:hypothetical protein